jgi:hypothetical protein
MKNKLLLSFITGILVMFTVSLSAQGFYVIADAGYGFKLASQNIEDFVKVKENLGLNKDEYTQINISMGKGFDFGASVGYMFSKNIGAELGISYLLGLKTKAVTDHIPPVKKDEESYAGKMLRIHPSFVITAGLDKLNPYAKFGVLIGIGWISHVNKYEDDVERYYYKEVASGGVALGFIASAGVMLKLNDRISFFCEANMVNMSYAPTKAKAKKLTNHGVDQLWFYPTSLKETKFVKTIDEFETAPVSEPSKALRQKYAFGSIGVNAGIKINFKK